MYHEFFGLKEPAFSIAVNPRYLYMSDQHREALAHLLYGIRVGGFVLLTGEVGTGKTTIVRCLLEQLPENTDIAIVLNPMASASELLCTICDELGVRYLVDQITIKELVDSLYAYLLESHTRGRKTVLLIDEAQLLKPNVLEQIRLLTNLETTTEKLLQIILVGQPELKKLLERPSLRQLSQRITARFHLQALTLPETRAYVSHRLDVAGLRGPNPFSPAILERVHQFSGGVPRLINVLCERMLLGAYAKQQAQVDEEIFRLSAQEVSGQEMPPPRPWYRSAGFSRGLAGLSLVLLVVAAFWVGRSLESVSDPSASGLAQESSVSSDSSVDVSSQAPNLVESSPEVSLDMASEEEAAEAESASSAAETDTVEPAPDFWVRDLALAQQTLWEQLQISDPGPLCAQTGPFACERQQLASWNDLREINRPMVLTLLTADKKLAYTTLVGLTEDKALVRLDDHYLAVDWAQLANLWQGQVYYLWRRPPAYERPLSGGERGHFPAWLAQQFAQLDQQPKPLSHDTYSPVLKRRVQLFQAEQQLDPDGIVGTQTLRRLNERLGLDELLLTDEAAFSVWLDRGE